MGPKKLLRSVSHITQPIEEFSGFWKGVPRFGKTSRFRDLLRQETHPFRGESWDCLSYSPRWL